MKREKLLTISVVLLLVFNAATLLMLLRRPPFPPEGGRPGRPDKLIVEGLKLDAVQIEKFEELKKAHHEAIMAYNEKERNLHDVYFSGLKSGNVRAADQLKLQTEMGKISGQKDSITYDHFLQLRKICRPDQTLLFDRLIDEILETFHPKNPHRN